MNSFHFLFVFAVAIIATNPVIGYGPSAGPAEVSAAGSSPGAVASASEGAAVSGVGHSAYGNNQNLPYAPGNTRGNSITSSITYPQNKGEILIHRPAAIIVKRPPTRVLVNHPPLVVKPAPVVLHKPPAVVLRKVYVKQYPRPVKVEPVYVNVVKPPAEKYFVNEKQQQLAGSLSPVPSNLPAIGQVPSASGAQSLNLASLAGIPGFSGLPASANAGPDGAAANSGYQLLSGHQGYAALANIGVGSGPNPYGPHQPVHY